MSRTLRTATFKKKVALEALREDKTMGQIASEYSVHPIQVSKWKKDLIEGAEIVFERRSRRKQPDLIDRDALERKIGQLTVELDYLKKKLGL